MLVFTNIYEPNVKTEHMLKSFKRFGYEMEVHDTPLPNGRILKDLYRAYGECGHETFLYSDGGDTYCQIPFFVPEDVLLWSAEQACYPLPDRASGHPPADSPWRYLNNGGYCGPTKLMTEFVKRYQLDKIPDDCTGQLEVMDAFIKANGEGFPIQLDYECEVFQSIAFDSQPNGSPATHEDGIYNGTDFEVGTFISNRVTETTPAILHGNGLTPMEWIYDTV